MSPSWRAVASGPACGWLVGLKCAPAELASAALQSPNSWTWKPCFPGVRPVISAWTWTPSATGVNVTVPLSLLPAVGCSTAIAFDDAADFAAGVCASAIKPANDASASPMNEARNEFISQVYFAPRDKSSRIKSMVRADLQCGTASSLTRLRSTVTAATAETLNPGLSTAFGRTRVRSGHNRKFFRPLPRRDRRCGSCSAGKQAPTHGLHTRSYRRYDSSRPRLLQ